MRLSEGTSFTPEKRLQVLEFPPPATQKALLQFIGLVNYFCDHIPSMTEMIKPLRELINQKKYKGSNKLDWTEEGRKAFDFCRAAVSNCQELLQSYKLMLPTMALVAICTWSLMVKSGSLDSIVSP